MQVEDQCLSLALTFKIFKGYLLLRGSHPRCGGHLLIGSEKVFVKKKRIQRHQIYFFIDSSNEN